MKRALRQLFGTATITILMLETPRVCTAAGTYAITDLGTLGGTASHAFGLNSTGQVVGDSLADTNVPPTKHAFLYSNGVMNDLGAISGIISGALGINDAGQVVGYTSTTPSSGNIHAFLYSGGVMNDLGTLGGVTSKAYAINNNGDAVGTANNGGNVGRAFLYSSGTMTDLGVPQGTAGSAATAINDSGLISGWFTTNCGCNADTHGFLYNGGTVMDLGALSGLGSLKATFADGINNNGQIVGSAENSSATISHPYLFSAGALSDLSAPAGIFTNASMYAINNKGQIAGKNLANGHALLYSGGVMSDLNSLIDSGTGWTLVTAQAINDNGQIAGYGTSPSGQQHAYLLTPKPVLQNLQVSAGYAQLELLGMTGVTYRVQYAQSIPATNWSLLTNVLPVTLSSLISDPAAISGSRFYRAVLIQ